MLQLTDHHLLDKFVLAHSEYIKSQTENNYYNLMDAFEDCNRSLESEISWSKHHLDIKIALKDHINTIANNARKRKEERK